MKSKLIPLLAGGLLSCLAAPQLMAGLDNGVVVTNLGKGDWIWEMSVCETALGLSTPNQVIDYEAAQGMHWVTVKAGDGLNEWGQWDTGIINEAHAKGMYIFGWVYAYGNSSGSSESGELNVAKWVDSVGGDGLILDAEVEYNTQAAAASAYTGGIIAAYPNRFLAYAPFPIISVWPNWPYIQFGSNCFAVMPQAYWGELGYSPSGMVTELDSQWSSWQNGLVGSHFASSIKPIIPIGQGYNDSIYTDNGTEITGWITALKNDSSPATAGGYHGTSTWSSQHHTSNMWYQLSHSSIGTFADNAGVISQTVANNTVFPPNHAFSCQWVMTCLLYTSD